MKALNIYSKYIGRKTAAVLLCSLMITAPIQATGNEENFPPEVLEFIEETVSKHGLSKAAVTQVLQRAEKNQAVLDAIARPWEAKPWYQYYPIFLTDKRVDKGVAFWQEHKETLEKAEKEFGVPAQIITAIIGVETYYGSYKGKYAVLDALYSLGFYYPPRAKFFKKELGEFLRLTSEEKLDPMALKGSYAGAMGWGQFISSSYRHYAVDFDGDGIRDLLNNPVDAIGSVANYFKQHKWQPGKPVAYQAQIQDSDISHLLTDSLKIEHDWRQLAQANVSVSGDDISLSATTPAKLQAFEIESGTEYWAVLDNFYVITRYNHSPLYAMVVFQLSEQIKAKMETL